jgi:glycosyltransferase involved in cell wall biosynthesis
MAFSAEMADVGRLQASKLLHLLSVVVRILRCRVRTGAKVLYYPPAGPDLVPVVRDLVILLATRWAFEATVFHFHAGGLSEIWPRLPRALRRPFRAAYARPDLALQPSAMNPPDGDFLGARRTMVVPNGVPDSADAAGPVGRGPGRPTILYVGVIRESKGVLVLVEACGRLLRRGVDFELRIMGSFESPEFEQRLRATLTEAELQAKTALLGTRTGEQKAGYFATSDVFCYPTFFEAETFGLVVIEAMQFSLPVVASRWRGVSSVVADGDTGILVPPRDPEALADALQALLEDPARRERLGRRGRELYLEQYTEKKYRANMEAALVDVLSARE